MIAVADVAVVRGLSFSVLLEDVSRKLLCVSLLFVSDFFPTNNMVVRVAAEAVFGFSVMGLGSLLILSLLVIIEPSVELNLPSLYIAGFFIACARLKAYTSELSGALKPG